MYKTVELSAAEHDEFVMSHPVGDLLQLSGWAKSKELTDWYSRRIAVARDGEVVGVASLLFKKLPKVSLTMCYVSRGFVCDFSNDALVSAMLDAAIEVAKAEKSYVIKIDPDIEVEGNEMLIDRLKAYGFKHSGLVDGMSKDNIQPRQTMVTDITKPDKELIQSFESQNRTLVRRSFKRGTKVERAGREDMGIFKSLMDETGKRDGFLTRDTTYFLSMYDALNPTGNMELFLVKLEPGELMGTLTEEKAKLDKQKAKLVKRSEKKDVSGAMRDVDNQLSAMEKRIEELREILETHPEGIYLSGALLALSGEKAYYLYGASSDNYRSFLPNHNMQFTMMQYAREHGAKSYDFGGVSVEPGEDSPYFGLWRFKKAWGTEVSDKIGEFDYVLNKPVYTLLEKGVPLAQKAKVNLNKILNRKK